MNNEPNEPRLYLLYNNVIKLFNFFLQSEAIDKISEKQKNDLNSGKIILALQPNIKCQCRPPQGAQNINR